MFPANDAANDLSCLEARMVSATFLRTGALAALVLVAACDDNPVSSNPGPGPEPGEPGAVASVRTFPRFATELTATGSFRPGQPIQITLSARALRGTEGAQLEIVLPEVARAQVLGGYDAAPRPGAQISPASSRRTSMGRGSETQQHHVVTFPEPGYYSVWGTVRSDDAATADSGMVQNEAHKVLYLYIDERGGGVTEEFDPERLPATALRTLGPRRERPDVQPAPNLPRPPRMAGASASAGSGGAQSVMAQAGSMTVILDYYNASAGQYWPVADAEYSLALYDANFNVIGSTSGFTPANGNVVVNCSVYYASLYVYAYNSRTSVGRNATNFRVGETLTSYAFYPQSDCAAGRTYAFPNPTPVVAHVFNNLNRAQEGAVRVFGRNRPQMDAIIVNDASQIASRYCVNGTQAILGCGHGGADDYLRINEYVDPAPGGYGDQVWGQAGTFVQTHEYGHGYHEKALGGLMRYYNNCGGYHDMLTVMPNMACAYGEGFANYFAIVARPGETGYDYTWETNYYYLNEVRKTSTDGSRSESAIAAFLYDITDANTVAGAEAHDVVSYSGSVIADMMLTCKVYQGGAWILNAGIDHLVYCMERRVDPAVTGSSTYFTTRSPDPTGQQSSSAVTDPAQIRKLWLKNLYAM